MPRYEFSEGTSNKFWEIKLSGTQFTTTYGKIGTPGQTTIKTFKSDAEAKKEYDKLIAEKVKKGYESADGAGDADDEDEEEAAPPPPPPKPKAAAKPAAKPAAPAAAPASGGGGKRYFEFSEGTSNKFWEISIDGGNVKTRYGKIGTPGQQTLKELGSPAAAKKEYDKLIAEKTKKGYQEGSAGGGDHFEEIEE